MHLSKRFCEYIIICVSNLIELINLSFLFQFSSLLGQSPLQYILRTKQRFSKHDTAIKQ